MNSESFFLFVKCWIIVALVIFPIMLFVRVPYGRHVSSKWGLLMSNTAGWVLMEAPALLIFIIIFIRQGIPLSPAVRIFALFWIAHYTYRSFVYPFRTRTRNKKIPLLIVLLSIIFNSVNAWINAWYFTVLNPDYSVEWLLSLRFVLGTVLFISGFIINQVADNELIHLRRKGDSGYYIPRGLLFRRISCPNHAGEMLEWIGYAVMAWSLPALAFAVWTFANVLPRSLSHHRWYRSVFDNYPQNRKVVIPFLF